MGIAGKNRRKIIVNKRTYYWYVTEDVDSFPSVLLSNLYALNIISEDKRFIVRYHLGQENENTRHLTVIGEEFAGHRYHGSWRRFQCPGWGGENHITPKDVRAVIDWCHEDNKEIVEVDYKGLSIKKTQG